MQFSTRKLAAALIAGLMLVSGSALAKDNTGGVAANTLKVDFQAGVEQVAEGFDRPIYVTHAGDGSGRLFVVEKPGKIFILDNGKRLDQPFLDIESLVQSSGSEQGLLGLAFHPQYKTNGLFYVYYTARNNDQVVAQYQVASGDPNRGDSATVRELIRMDDPFRNHNGGMLVFGPDGFLYIGTGDGGGAGDPLRSGQNRKTLLGKILRIDVNSSANDKLYAIPPGNPFADGRDGLPEVWSYGWRNPWRFSFDRQTKDMYIGDVGQNVYEEISFERAGSPGGLNYGWNIMEGNHCFPARAECNRDGLVMPIAEYDHQLGISVTGGYVYRGKAFPRMQGTYFFADYGSARLWALKETIPNQWEMTELMQVGFPVSSFGEDEAGEVYLVDYSGKIFKLIDKG